MLLGMMVFLPMLLGIALYFIKPLDSDKARRIVLYTFFALELAVFFWVVSHSQGMVYLFSLTMAMPIQLFLDGTGMLFLGIVVGLLAVVGIYAIDYMKHEKEQKRFFCFYLLTMGALVGVCLSQNLITFYLFYELMTFLSVPLVMHTKTKEAVAAGIKYLVYSLLGAALALVGVLYFQMKTTNLGFAAGGVNINAEQASVLVIALVAILGFSVKAGMFPMHSWLPTAHPVAPSPASAILSGVITKMGVLGIVRIVYDVVGAQALRGTWVQHTLMTLSLITVLMGSMLAYLEPVLKKRLAYSSVSQVSYILFGLSLMNTWGFVGAMLHVVFHAIMKNTLFMNAGAIIMQTDKTKISDMRGIGKKMPVTMWCFALSSIALVGIPPLSGFVSKWYLAQGGLAYGYIGAIVLLVSALLTAGYLLPLVVQGFFSGKGEYVRSEVSLGMQLPMAVLTLLTVLLGICASPLIKFITTLIR